MYYIRLSILILFVATLWWGTLGCIPATYQQPDTVRHYEKGKYVGKSEIRQYGNEVRIRTYDKRGKLKSTSEGRIY